MEEMVIEGLTARIERSTPGSLSVRFAGRSASRNAGAVLAPLFARIVSDAREEKRAVVLHFDALEYFNSSTIAALVRFMRTVQEVGLGLEVVYDGRRRWQALSFDALRRALGPLQPADPGPGVTFRGS